MLFEQLRVRSRPFATRDGASARRVDERMIDCSACIGLRQQNIPLDGYRAVASSILLAAALAANLLETFRVVLPLSLLAACRTSHASLEFLQMFCTRIGIGVRPPLPEESPILQDFDALLLSLRQERLGVTRCGLDLLWRFGVVIIVVSEREEWAGVGSDLPRADRPGRPPHSHRCHRCRLRSHEAPTVLQRHAPHIDHDPCRDRDHAMT